MAFDANGNWIPGSAPGGMGGSSGSSGYDAPLGSYVGGDDGGYQGSGTQIGGQLPEAPLDASQRYGMGPVGPGGAPASGDWEEEMHQAAQRAKMGATTYREQPSSPWDMESGAGAFGDKMYGEAMGQSLGDTTAFDAARAQQQQGREEAGLGMGLLGESARGGGGNELLRESALGGGGNEYLGQFARGEGDIAQTMHDRAMGQNLVSEKVAAAQRDQLAGQIASQAASGRGGYDPATRRAAIGAMSELGQQGAATTAALGAQEAAQAGGQYQGIRMQGAQGYQRGVLGAQQAYQQGMLGSRQAYMGALQGQRGQDLGLMGAEQQDLGRQTAGIVGKMGIGLGYQQLGVQEKMQRNKAFRAWEQQRENNRYRASVHRLSGSRAHAADEAASGAKTEKIVGAVTGGFANLAKMGGGMAGGGDSGGGSAYPGDTSFVDDSDERGKKNKEPADMEAFLKSLTPLGAPAADKPGGATEADIAGAMQNAFVSVAPLTGARQLQEQPSFRPTTPPAPSMERPALPSQPAPPPVDPTQPDTAVYGHGGAAPVPPEVLQAMQRTESPPPPIGIHQGASAPMGEFVDDLEPYQYDYIDQAKHGEGRHTGVMAQDLEKSSVGRGLVGTGPDNMKTVDYDPKKLGPIMLAALGHLNNRIDSMKKGRG